MVGHDRQGAMVGHGRQRAMVGHDRQGAMVTEAVWGLSAGLRADSHYKYTGSTDLLPNIT